MVAATTCGQPGVVGGLQHLQQGNLASSHSKVTWYIVALGQHSCSWALPNSYSGVQGCYFGIQSRDGSAANVRIRRRMEQRSLGQEKP